MSHLPFQSSIFWKVLPTVYILVVLAWVVVVRFSDYEMTSADYGGSFICATVFSYLVHLWLLPGDVEPDEQEFESEEDAE